MNRCKHLFPLIIMMLIGIIVFMDSCGDTFSKEIDIDTTNFPPRLAVTAILDTDSLTVSISEARSLASYSNWQPENESIIKKGSIELFENDQRILLKEDMFDISMRANSPSGYHTVINGLPATKPGNVYHLKVSLDGYDTVEATATMPEAPVIGNLKIDTLNVVKKNSYFSTISLGDEHSSGGSKFARDYYPITVEITDDIDKPDYYSFQQYLNVKIIEMKGVQAEVEDMLFWEITAQNSPMTFTSNMNIIRDNPDFEARALMVDNEPYELYGTDMLLVTDVSFTSSLVNLPFYTAIDDLFNPNHAGLYYYGQPLVLEKHRRTGYDPEKDGPEIHIKSQLEIVVKHVTTETFQHYRSLALQQQGVGFFTEPMNIKTNLKNGRGCFSLSSSYRFSLLDEERYYYIGSNNN